MTSDTEATKTIKEIATRLLGMLDIQATSISCRSKESEDSQGRARTHLHVSVQVQDFARLIIGTRGSHLIAFQHLLRCIASRQYQEVPYVTVDINNYIAMREEATLNLAKQAARKAGRTRHAVVLPPMSAAQRHSVHASLASRTDIQTESLGQEPNRRIVIRPVF